MAVPDLANERLGRIAAFVQSYLQEAADRQGRPAADVNYRWQHTLRVCHYGQSLATAEGGNPEIVLAACLLHDVGTFEPGEWDDHGRRGAEIARPVLQDMGYLPREIEAICYAVANHVDVDRLETIEAKIVTDADNIDRFGAYQILRWCQEDQDDFEHLADRLAARLPRLQHYRRRQLLETASGTALFRQHVGLQITVFRALLREREMSRMPRLEPLPEAEQPMEGERPPARIRAACV
jgi:uncharacterized protein